jgi:hypothetical protein
MEWTPGTTFVVASVLFILICAGDYVLYVKGGTRLTLSGVVRDWGERWPLLRTVIPFLLGVLTAHFFGW